MYALANKDNSLDSGINFAEYNREATRKPATVGRKHDREPRQYFVCMMQKAADPVLIANNIRESFEIHLSRTC